VRRIRELARDQKGGTLIEYGLILALIFIVMMVAVHALAVQVTGTINHVKNEVVNASDV
jgi:pilus assembly protein Flp/PilA